MCVGSLESLNLEHVEVRRSHVEYQVSPWDTNNG